MKASFGSFVLIPLLLLSLLRGCSAGSLVKGFYAKTCPKAEGIVRNITWSFVASNPALPAKLVRLHYHDCFVKGCDASILLDPTSNSTTRVEKQAGPNLSLGGFDVIDAIKTAIEQACPGIVSCADILALAARDSVAFQFRTSMWDVLTGRKDGTVSLASDVSGNLPSPFNNFTVLQKNFASKGLGTTDLVALSGAHTLGVAHCFGVNPRLYNFTGKGDADPSLDPAYAATLRTQCTNPPNPATTVEMDPGSSQSFDSNFFVILGQHKGLFVSDAALLTNSGAATTASKLRKPTSFFSQFADSMKKMGAIGVLTGTDGQIRKQCRAVN